MHDVTIVDYGLGNIQAFNHIYSRLNIKVNVASTPEELTRANRLILPGVGAFDWAMTNLNQSGLRSSLDKMVLERNIPVLGVCVGMQMMAFGSEEGSAPGLGWIDGQVLHFSKEKHDLPALPHMGWNDIAASEKSLLFQSIDSPSFYFLHSYYFLPEHEEATIATANYGKSFTAAVNKENIYGTQFHPEKSHHWGISLLENFAHI